MAAYRGRHRHCARAHQVPATDLPTEAAIGSAIEPTDLPTEAAIGTAIEPTKSPTDLPTEAAIGTAIALPSQSALRSSPPSPRATARSHCRQNAAVKTPALVSG